MVSLEGTRVYLSLVDAVANDIMAGMPNYYPLMAANTAFPLHCLKGKYKLRAALLLCISAVLTYFSREYLEYSAGYFC